MRSDDHGFIAGRTRPTKRDGSCDCSSTISLHEQRACAVGQIRFTFPRVPPRQEGRIAIVTTRGVGCDGRDVSQCIFDARTNGRARTAKSCGPGIPVLMPSLRATSARATGAISRSPGRSRISVKTVAQGRPVVRLVPVVLPRAFCCTRTMGAIGIRPSLRPLHQEGRTNKQASDANVSRERAVTSASLQGSAKQSGIFAETWMLRSARNDGRAV
jgi:hypothetical protein